MSFEGFAFAFDVANAVFTGIIAVVALRFAATPRIAVKFTGEDGTGRTDFAPAEVVSLRFALTNIGRFYAKPAAKNMRVYVNFEASFEPTRLRYGSVLELSTDTFRRGKFHSKYFIAKGIDLFYGEHGEDLVAEVRMPEERGEHQMWIAAASEGCDYPVQEFTATVA